MWKNNFEIVTCNYDIIAHVCIMPLSIKFLIYSKKMSEEGDKIEICFDLENCSTIAHITHIYSSTKRGGASLWSVRGRR